MQGTADSSLGHSRAGPGFGIDRGFALASAVALAAVCGLMWLAGWHSRGWISAWPRFQDDAYYYLVIARNVAAGHGFTMDQLSPTNGFQPLWLWLLVPVARFTNGDTALFLGVAQGICVALFAAGGGLLCGFLRARLGLVPALLCGFVLLFPRFLNIYVSGVEAALVLLILAALVIEAVRSDALSRTEPRAADARVGVLAGLLMLARLDSVFLGVALAGYVALHGIARGEGGFAARLWRTLCKELALFWPTLALVVPYLAWNLLSFGHFVPISGTVKSSFPEASFNPGLVGVEYAVLLLVALGAAAREIWRGNGRDPLVIVVGVLSIGLLLHALHTTLYMRWAVFAWHFAVFVPIGALGLAILARERAARLSRAGVAGALCLLAAFLAVAESVSISRMSREFTVSGREAGIWAAKELPADAVLGMKDSGIFSYFSRRRVMNLDGVANSFEFATAVCSGELENFVRSHGVEYVVQHNVPHRVRNGAYETFVQVYPCHLRGGRDGELVLRRDHEVYRGSPYANYLGDLGQLVIWRLAPRDSEPVHDLRDSPG